MSRRHSSLPRDSQPSIQTPHIELTEEEILSLLSTTKRQLQNHPADSKVHKEFQISCWQLCGVGCHQGDSACLAQQCESLCHTAAEDSREAFQLSGQLARDQGHQLETERTREGQDLWERATSKGTQLPRQAIEEYNNLAETTQDNEGAYMAQRLAPQQHHLPTDFLEEEKILQNRRAPIAKMGYEYGAIGHPARPTSDMTHHNWEEEEFKESPQQRERREAAQHNAYQRSNDLLGEAFAESQELLQNGMDENDDLLLDNALDAFEDEPAQGLPSDMTSQQYIDAQASSQHHQLPSQSLPQYFYALIVSLAVILVLCSMIFALIMEPGTKEQEAKRKAQEERRRRELRKVAKESWTVQPERLDNQVFGNQARELENQVYKKL